MKRGKTKRRVKRKWAFGVDNSTYTRQRAGVGIPPPTSKRVPKVQGRAAHEERSKGRGRKGGRVVQGVPKGEQGLRLVVPPKRRETDDRLLMDAMLAMRERRLKQIRSTVLVRPGFKLYFVKHKSVTDRILFGMFTTQQKATGFMDHRDKTQMVLRPWREMFEVSWVRVIA